MNLGDKLPSVPFQATDALQGNLHDYLGKWLILYFYPKDATPGCTREGQDFRDSYSEFEALDAVIFGISRDSLKSHEHFKTKQQFPFELISDTDEVLCQQFEVIKMKSMYGKSVRGIERSTFVFGPDGTLKNVWRKVSVKDHVTEVLKSLGSVDNSLA